MPAAPTPAPSRPPSPWPGSSRADRYRWQLDGARTLPEAAAALRALADVLRAAHEAGWSLGEPVGRGHLFAARPSRRTRTLTGPVPLPPDAGPPVLRVRLRLVDEPAAAGEERLDVRRVPRSPVLDAGLRVVDGPPVPDALLAEIARQVRPADAMAAAGGRLQSVDDGLLLVGYGPP